MNGAKIEKPDASVTGGGSFYVQAQALKLPGPGHKNTESPHSCRLSVYGIVSLVPY